MAGDTPTNLAPRRTRLITFGVLVLIAVAAIWLIDRRAIQRMHEYRRQHETPAQMSTPKPDRGASAREGSDAPRAE